jgi:hypothetical protein
MKTEWGVALISKGNHRRDERKGLGAYGDDIPK